MARNRTRVDDALDVFACHGVAGIIGALLTGVFATKAVNAAGADGLLAGNPRLVWVQALAILTTMAVAAPMTALILSGIPLIARVRVTLRDDLTGVDVSEHGEQRVPRPRWVGHRWCGRGHTARRECLRRV